jgi:hypothetical protein
MNRVMVSELNGNQDDFFFSIGGYSTSFVGTAEYVPPELITERRVDRTLVFRRDSIRYIDK